MRITEYIDWINRKDLKLGRNLEGDFYTHMTIRMEVKRARYQYQKALRGEKIL